MDDIFFPSTDLDTTTNFPGINPETLLPDGANKMPDNSSTVDSSPYNQLIDKANQQNRNYGRTALFIFVNSSSFQQAYDSFSHGPNPDEWLARLYAIANAIPEPTYSFWDVIREGFSGSWTKEQNQYAAAAQEQLQILISEWQSFINSLPSTQRQQYADAGLNIALDGGSALTGSSISASSAPGFANTGLANQDFDNAMNFATSLSDGLLSLIQTVNTVFSGVGQRDISRENVQKTAQASLQSLNLQRYQLGLNPLSSLSGVDSLDDIAVKYLSDKNFYKNVSEKERAEIDSIISQGMGISLQESQKREGQFGEFSNITQQLGQIYFGQMLYDKMAAYEKSKFIYENSQKTNQMSLDSQEVGLELQKTSLQSAKSQFSESDSLNAFHKKLIDYKRSVLSHWVNTASSDDPNAWLYASLLMKSNFDMTDFMSPADVGFDYGKNVTDLIQGFFPKFSLGKGSKTSK